MYERLFGGIELVDKRQYETDVSVFDRDVVVRVDFDRAVVLRCFRRGVLLVGFLPHCAKCRQK